MVILAGSTEGTTTKSMKEEHDSPLDVVRVGILTSNIKLATIMYD